LFYIYYYKDNGIGVGLLKTCEFVFYIYRTRQSMNADKKIEIT